MALARGVGKKRCVRYPVSFTNEQDLKISSLAVSCDMSKSELIGIAVDMVLNNVEAIHLLQDRFNKKPEYRVYPIRENGRVLF